MYYCCPIGVGLSAKTKGGKWEGVESFELLYGPFLQSIFDYANLTTPSTSCAKGPQYDILYVLTHLRRPNYLLFC